jgi:hypothetical protein
MVTPAGKTVRKLGAVACAAVTFKTTALALAGTPSVAEVPATVTGVVTPAPIAVPIGSVPKARLGESGL